MNQEPGATAQLDRAGTAAGERTSSTTDTDTRATIEAALVAQTSLSAAVAFRKTIGLDRLEQAVSVAEGSDDELACAGRRDLADVRAYREAAAGDHFHRGRNTSLGGAGLRPDE